MHSTCVASVLRSVAVSTIGTVDPTWDYLPALLWSSIEVNVAVICNCLPVMMPLVQAVVNTFRDRVTSGKSASQNKTVSDDPRHFQAQRPFARLEEGSKVVLPSNAAMVGSDDYGAYHKDKERRAIPLDPIHITKNATLDYCDKD